MPDDRKHLNELKLRLTDREMLDLSRMAARDERLTAEFARMVLRRFMYGVCDGLRQDGNETMSPDEGRTP